MSSKKILVTGSSGTVGTALTETLLDRGFDVTGVDAAPNRWSSRVNGVTTVADLTDPAAVHSFPTDVDVIVHLAAHARVHDLVKWPTGAKENIDMTFNVLEHARTADVPRVLFASSREVYGNKDKTIYSEEDTFADECESPYTASKISGESLLNAYERCYGIESCVLRFSNVYGRYDASDRVVPLFIAQAHRGQDLTVYGDNKVLDFTYIDDCVEGTLRAIEKFHKVSGTTLNIASGEGTSIVELAEAVRDRYSTDVDLRVEPNRTGEVSRHVSNVDKAGKMLNYEPSYSFDRGLRLAIEWYEEREHLFDEILE
jgi:UDP-glucose 4-epimerase